MLWMWVVDDVVAARCSRASIMVTRFPRGRRNMMTEFGVLVRIPFSSFCKREMRGDLRLDLFCCSYWIKTFALCVVTKKK